MNRYVVRAATLASLTATVLLAACGTKEVGKSKLNDLERGISRTELLAKLGTGPLTAVGSDTARLVSGFRHMRYFAAGKNFEVVYYREEAGNVAEPVEQAKETPVVLQEEKVLGWGWKYYVEAMKEFNLPTPLVEKYVAPKPDSNAARGMQGQPGKPPAGAITPGTATPPAAPPAKKP